MRARECRDAMPGDLVEVEILNPVAVNVDFVLARQTVEAFGYTSLGTMALVNKWRNNCDAGLRHRPAHSLPADPDHFPLKISNESKLNPKKIILAGQQIANEILRVRASLWVAESAGAFVPALEAYRGPRSATRGRRYSHSSDKPAVQNEPA